MSAVALSLDLSSLSPVQAIAIFLVIAAVWIGGVLYAILYVRPSALSTRPPTSRRLPE